MSSVEIVVVLAVAAIVGYAFIPVRKRYDLHAFVQKPLLTPNELEFYGRLTAALPDYLILAQVSMGALVDISTDVPEKYRVRLREMFNRKIVDYVVCSRNMRVIALVELDDRTHDATRDQLRDTLTYRAGYPTLRYESKRKPSLETLASDVAKLATKAEVSAG